MKNATVLLVYLLASLAILLGTGGTRAVLAENILLKQQLLVLQRSRRRPPNLGPDLARILRVAGYKDGDERIRSLYAEKAPAPARP